MFLKSLKLTNFRNYSKSDFKFETAITVLIGNNAQGKSNFLESIYFLATAKSTKAEKDEELIKWSEQVVIVEGEVQESANHQTNQSGVNSEIAMQLDEETSFKKRIKVNGISRRVSDYSEN